MNELEKGREENERGEDEVNPEDYYSIIKEPSSKP